MVASTAETDLVYASQIIGDFTTHLRGTIRAMSNDSVIPFSEELKNIMAYANIEKMRLAERLTVNYEINVRDFSIIPLSIQPLVENAIRHGVYERGEAGGSVTIRSLDTSENWIVQVEDNGVGFDTAEIFQQIADAQRDSHGLRNLIFRLETIMNATVDIKSQTGTGTVITVRIPKVSVSDASSFSE